MLPYITDITNRIARILSRYNIKTIYTTNKKVSKLFGNLKDKFALENHKLYGIFCGVWGDKNNCQNRAHIN